jgi:hypothetical protein
MGQQGVDVSHGARETMGVATGDEEVVISRYGGVIGSEGSCCVYPVKILELEEPLMGRILCIEVDSINITMSSNKSWSEILGEYHRISIFRREI